MFGADPRTRAALLLALVSATLVLAGTASLPLLDRDEPRFAHATIEMMRRGDWVVPYFNDEFRFDKPPLTYWLMALGYVIFGVGELGARFHSVVATVATTLVIFAFARRLYGRPRAFAAAFAWATCVQVFVHGRLAVADMPMVLAVTVMHWALWELLFGAGSTRWRLVLWTAAAAGFLAKGPIALAVPAITLLVLRLLGGRGSVEWRRLGALWGVPLSLTLIGAWGIPALLRTGGAFWDVGIGEHVVRRGVAAFNDRPIVPGYYLITILLSLFPWSPNLGQFVVTLRRRWQSRRTCLLLGWVAGPFLIFSFYSTQLPHYTLPAFPALLMLLFSEGIDPRRFPLPSRVFYWLLHGTVAALLVAVVGYAKWLDVPAQLHDLKVGLAGLAAVLLALQAAAVLYARRQRRGEPSTLTRLAPALAMLAVAALGTSLVATMVRPQTAPIRLLPHHARVPAAALHVAMGYAEPSLIFYSDTFWRLNEGPTRAEIAAPGMFVYRVADTGLDRLFAPGAQARRDQAVASCGAGTDTAASLGAATHDTPADGAAASGTLPAVDALARAAGVPGFVIDSDLSRAVVCGFNFARSTWTELVVFYRESTPPR